MAQHKQELVVNKADDIGPATVDTTHVTPKAASSDSGNGSHGGDESAGQGQIEPSPVLESEAESKGRWFQYVKTKQFWLVLLLGQGAFYFPLFSPVISFRIWW